MRASKKEKKKTKTYKISEIALLTELPIATLRYYEELDLLKPARNSSNYREFTEADLEWIFFIKRAKATGMSLAKIQDYSRLREQGDSTIIQRISLLVEQERILRQQITDLEGHLDFILQKKHHYYETLQKNSES
ncbi:MerR family transcriptional regulator [Lactococcus lactis]|uniref:MerR family transcriptional regulator n=1 Tax=Lactococcus lactis TaxID=1358 RepID=UPI003A8093D9